AGSSCSNCRWNSRAGAWPQVQPYTVAVPRLTVEGMPWPVTPRERTSAAVTSAHACRAPPPEDGAAVCVVAPGAVGLLPAGGEPPHPARAAAKLRNAASGDAHLDISIGISPPGEDAGSRGRHGPLRSGQQQCRARVWSAVPLL